MSMSTQAGSDIIPVIQNVINFAMHNWNMQWSILAFAIAAFVLFLLKEKPVTGSLRWSKKHTLKVITWLFNWIRKKRKKVVPDTKLTSSPFKKLLGSLRALSTMPNSLYDTPTYLALSVDADIPDLLNSANSGDPERLFLHTKNNDDWFIFNQGAVLNFPDPNEIVDELTFHRPERPADGVILFVSVSLLKKSRVEIEQAAEIQLRKLWYLQKHFKFVLPVYLVFTDCDQVDGFNLFWKREELHQHTNKILGWSNPDEKHHPYDSAWIINGLTEVTDVLRRLHLNFIHSSEPDPSESVLLFPGRMNALSGGINTFCSCLFSRTNYHESFMFRGFYFSGKLNVGDGDKPILLEELFSKRIFAEANLAYPPQQKLFSSNRRLRSLQFALGLTIISSFVWLAVDAWKLNTQSQNLANQINAMPAAPKNSDPSANIQYLYTVLDKISSMDASSMRYWSILPSLFSPAESELQDYFAEQIFGNVVFPAFQCRANHQLVELKSNAGNQNYSQWLHSMNSKLRLRAELHDLMSNKFASTTQVEQIFSNLVDQLYDTRLPEGFYQNSTIYFDAIKEKDYNTSFPLRVASVENSPSRVYCQTAELNNQNTWHEVKNLSNHYLENVSKQVSAPKVFFENVLTLPSISKPEQWSLLNMNFGKALNDYLAWSKDIEQNWLLEPESGNQCDRLDATLGSIAGHTVPSDSNYMETFVKSCTANIIEQMEKDNKFLSTGLYTFNEDKTQVAFSPYSSGLMHSMRAISGLSYIGIEYESNLAEGNDEFFWSVERLNIALRLFGEYKEFAAKQYDSLSLPTEQTEKDQTYLAQAVALKQLQHAMLQSVSNARIDVDFYSVGLDYKPVNRREAQVQNYVENFRKARNALLALNDAFSTLTLESSRKDLTLVAQKQAYAVLEKIDALYAASRLYTPKEFPNWGAHIYTRALFGIQGEGQLEDYLQSQSDRLNHIALNYAEPIVAFLRQLDAQNQDFDYALISKWENTVVEIQQADQNKDIATTKLQLEMFFKDRLININQSNCFEETKNLSSPGQNDVFADSQRDIVNDVKSLCNRYKADQIQKEYTQLFTNFTKRLANRYPFSKSDSAPSISLAALQAFMQEYPGEKSGLAERMDNLVWAKRHSSDKQQYQDAFKFVQNLDASLALFEALIGASKTPNSPGLEVAVEFDVLPRQADLVNHISQWQLFVGQSNLIYPVADTKPRSLFWLPGNNVSLQLNWAAGSPFKAKAKNGNTQGNLLIFNTSDTWSLLRFIKRHQTALADTDTLIDESILLNFAAKVTNPNNKAETLTALALMRMTLLGFDPENKQQVAIKWPQAFPAYAPIIPSIQNKGAQHDISD